MTERESGWFIGFYRDNVSHTEVEYDAELQELNFEGVIDNFQKLCETDGVKWGYLIQDITGDIVYTYLNENLDISGIL